MIRSAMLIVLIATAGCYTNAQVLVRPDNPKDWVRCANSGWGYVGAPMAAVAQHGCVADAKRLGYVELREEDE